MSRLIGIALVLEWAGAVSSSASHPASGRPVPIVEMVDARTGARYTPPAAEVLETRLAPLLAESQTPGGMEKVVDAVLLHAREHGRPVMEIEVIPEDEESPTTTDSVRLRVWPGLISSLSLEGGTEWSRAVIAADWKDRTGGELDLHAIERWLDWTHRNPFHQVTLAFDPGSQPATSDGVLSLHSQTVVRPFFSWRDDGVEPLGPQRFSTGFELGDPGGLPLWMSAELVGGEDWPDYRSVRGQVRWFLPWHHELRLAASQTSAELDGFLPGLPITSSLDSVEANIRYVVPLGKWHGWWVDAGAGFDFRRTESGVSLDGELEEGRGDTAQWVVEAAARRMWAGGEAVGVLSGFWSPGGMTGANETEDVEALRPGAEAEYAGVRAEGMGRWEWAGGWAVVGRGAAQWTSAPPLPTVQLAMSGAQAVRGFDEAVVLADTGAWGGVEVHAPSWSVPVRGRPLGLVPLVFADAGWARNEAEDDESTLASAGVGLRVRSGRQLGAAVDYGWRLSESGGRVHFALILSF